MLPKLSIRNLIALGLTLASLGLLYPGLTLPMMSMEISMDLLFTRSSLLDETQSVVSSIETLLENKHAFVAFLILLFSIVVPLIKASLILSILLIRSLRPRAALLHKVIYTIGKWSMADVFVVAILISFLAISANENVNAELHSGYYYFLGYCILSLAAAMVVKVDELES